MRIKLLLEFLLTIVAKLQSSIITPNPDAESVPIDLSKKHASDDLDRKSILEDKSNLLFDPLQTIQSHQQVLYYFSVFKCWNDFGIIVSVQSEDDVKLLN